MSRRRPMRGDMRGPLSLAEVAAMEAYARQVKPGYGISETNERLALLERDVVRLAAEVRRLTAMRTEPTQLALGLARDRVSPL